MPFSHIFCLKIQVKFVVGYLPNDMKMLAFLGCKLSNSATSFSTFVDASKLNISNFKGSCISAAGYICMETKSSWEVWG